MAVTNFTSLLGLALPTTGDLSGTWGDAVNDSITSLLDSAVAGTTTLSADADVTLTSTNGAANQSRSAIINCSGARTTVKNITAPASSKAYVVINATSGGYSVVIRGVGPTTGVTITNGTKALVAWNGTDFVKVASSVINLASEVTGTLPVTNGGTGVATITGIVKGSGTSAFSAATAGTDYLAPPSGTAILKANSGGALANAVSGTDYAPATTGTAILKASSGGFANAVAGTDYAPATTGSAILKGNGTGGFSSAVAGTDYVAVSGALGTPTSGNFTGGTFTWPSFNQTTTGSAAKWTTARDLAGNSVDGSANVAFNNKFVVQGTADAGLSGAQFLGALGTGIVKNTTSTGVLSIAVSGTDYAPATATSSILKGNGSGGFSGAVSGTDYAPATGGTAILKGSGTGGFSSAVSGTDYAPATSGSAILKGNGSGAFSSATAGTDYLAPPSGSAILKANAGGALANAVSGTDYAPATTGTSILKASSGGFANAVSGTDYAPATSGAEILYGNGTGGFSNVTVGTGLSFSTGTLSATVTMTYPAAGIAVSTGSAWGTSKTTPSGTIVGTSDTQTLTNKTLTTPIISTISNTGTLTLPTSTDTLVGRATTDTLTNKRVTPRASTTTSSATPTINTDSVDIYGLTAQAVDITSFTTNLSGTPTNGQKLWIYIVGTASRAITWGASFESSTATLPTTTVSTDRIDIGFVWNAVTSKWRCVGVA